MVVGVILRVPALFIAEVWYRSDPKSIHSHYEAPVENNNLNINLEKSWMLLSHAAYYSGKCCFYL